MATGSQVGRPAAAPFPTANPFCDLKLLPIALTG
jgi:hypothetical protein